MPPFFACLLVLVAFSALMTSAQTSPHDRLDHALALVQQGQFSAAIQATKPLIDGNSLRGPELGRAWALLGFAYREEGLFAESHQALDRSIGLLEHDAAFSHDYAVALYYLGALNEEEGQLGPAEHVWLKALSIGGKSSFNAEVYRNLAELKLQEHHVQAARDYLEKATSEAHAAGDSNPADRAGYALTEGWLALEEKNFPEALNASQRSLDLCKLAYGENNFLTGWSFMLFGKALAQEGRLDEGLAKMRQGLTIIDRSMGRQNPKYWTAEIAYSQVLDLSGSHSEAAQLRNNAEHALKDLYGRQCRGCTISVSALQ